MRSDPIRPAGTADLAAIDAALTSLSRELGDPHRAGVKALDRALFGAPPSTWAQIAEGPNGLAGLVLFAPVFSTVRGGAGVFVSDLWVDSAARGSGLGAALLRAAAEVSAALWDADFMRLSVHDDNARARAFYKSMGFKPAGHETVMILTGQGFQDIRRTT